MHKKIIALKYSGNIEDELLNINARDNSNEPFIELKKHIFKSGYSLEQFKFQKNINKILVWNCDLDINSNEKIKNIFKFFIHILGLRKYFGFYLKKIKKRDRFLILWEGKAVFEENFNKSNHLNYSKILTWDDDLVDNIKYFKFFLPIPSFKNSVVTKFDERKLLVNISSNKKSNYPYELYSKRLELIKYFNSIKPKDFDLYGLGWDQITLDEHKITTYKGKIDNKHSVLSNYKFSICFENNADQCGNITEKIFDSLRAYCIPIYLGAPNIANYIPSDCFIDFRAFESFNKLEKYITSFSSDDFEKFRNANEKFLNSESIKKFSTFNFISTIDKVIEL
jgi:hypothetical protein